MKPADGASIQEKQPTQYIPPIDSCQLGDLRVLVQDSGRTSGRFSVEGSVEIKINKEPPPKKKTVYCMVVVFLSVFRIVMFDKHCTIC